MIGKNIKRFREAKGLTQYKLADLSGLTKYYVSRLESEKVNNPGILTIKKISIALNVKVDSLIDEKEIDKELNKFKPDCILEVSKKELNKPQEINIKVKIK